MLMALRSKDVDLKLISLCFGNCDTESSLKNTLTMFNVLKLEEQFRQTKLGTPSNGNVEIKLAHSKPMVSIGMSTALDGSQLDATDFHGIDGLGNVHTKAPEFTAPKAWMDLFTSTNGDTSSIPADLPFVPSSNPAYLDILQVLKDEDPDSVVIVAIGPLMNLAKAAEHDPHTFSRVKHVVSMGGTLCEPGNVTPYAEFNVFSDALAASKVYELTSIQAVQSSLIPKKLEFTLFPLDITGKHMLLEIDYLNMLEQYDTSSSNDEVNSTSPRLSPLLEWSKVWLTTTFETMKMFYGYDLLTPEEQKIASETSVGIEMHDPLALWYAITGIDSKSGYNWVIDQDADIRVECDGNFTRGMTVKDIRMKPKRNEPVKNDHGTWLSTAFGNRLNVAVNSPYGFGPGFGKELLDIIFS